MPEHPTDAHFSFTFVFKQALTLGGGFRPCLQQSLEERGCDNSELVRETSPI